MNSATGREKYAIRAVERALQVLLCFTRVGPELTIDEIAGAVDLHKSTVYRILATLEVNGFLERDPHQEVYRLGSAALLVGAIALGQMDLRRKARPYLEQLMQTTGETVHLAILNQDQGLVIDKIESFRSIRMASTIGFRSPVHCTGVGKVLLAYQPASEIDRLLARNGLPRHTRNTMTDPGQIKEQLTIIRQQGFALDQEEIEPGLRCVAAPIRDYTGQVVASISISGPSGRITEETLPELIDVVKEHALRISREMGYRAERDGG